MTLPYNASHNTMKNDFKEELEQLEYDKENKCCWYDDNSKAGNFINTHDISLLITTIKRIIEHDFTKIVKLTKYLRNVAKLFNVLNLSIYWSLPSGLNIYQSYLSSKSITISPFTYSKIKLNRMASKKDKFYHNKLVRALMPNLIHSLDSCSLTAILSVFY